MSSRFNQPAEACVTIGQACNFDLISVTTALQWTSSNLDGSTIYVCDGKSVNLNFEYALDNGEEITSVEWVFNGNSEEMIAFLAHNAFAPMPTFSGRVQQGSTNGGLVISHVTQASSGNYTIEVSTSCL